MAEPKPVLKKIKGGYKATIGPYTTKVLVKKGRYNPEPLNVETHSGRTEVASLNGTTTGDTARFADIFPSENISKRAGLRALAILMPCTEMALRRAGIKTIGGRTHPTFARFLKQIGWSISGEGKTHCDVEKDISKNRPKFLFRIRPLPRKIKKKRLPRKPRKRL